MPPKKNKTVRKSLPPQKNSEQSPERKNKEFPIVGIAASAGGLEAFTVFLKKLPVNTDMAFVFVQHQDPSHPSSLTDLLKRVTRLPVHLAKNGMKVEPNQLYVMPPGSSMTIINGLLRLNPRSTSEKPHMPADSFFRSLAEYRQNKAIGVILSGTASDGTLGLKAIKEAGGITFAQDQESAKYDGMPRSAVNAGVVDFVLPPEKIADELSRIGSHPFIRKIKAEETEPPKEIDSLTTIFAIIRKATGVDFTHYKPTTVMRRLSRRMLLRKVEDLKGYAQLLQRNPDEVMSLYEDILINVTNFFRDPETFEVLKNEILPKLFKKTLGAAIRIWIPGCSTGEEAFSIAMVLVEALGQNSAGTAIQIFATDISESAIEKARTGLFSYDITNDVRSDRLKRFFTKTDQGYCVNKMIRDMCIFAKHNVVKDPPFSRIDLISCRNLLIYFGPLLQKKVIPIFHYALNPNGYLMLGNTEALGSFSDYFYPADLKSKIFSKKSAPSRVHYEPDHVAVRTFALETQEAPSRQMVSERDILKEGDRLILSRFAPASVIINDELQILQFRGRTGPYLEPLPGQASLNLLKMAREGFGAELRSAIVQARKENVAVQKPNIQILSDGDTKKFTLEVIPFSPNQSAERFFLVLFESPSLSVPKAIVPKKEAAIDQKQSHLLRQELDATKEYLQSIIEEQESTNEELRAANEEILSSNEELQSTNEELETAKEELQSANEELTTVNEELEIRNTELFLTQNDLTNLLASVQIPILMVGRDLRIRKITPMAEKIMNLIPTDIGRMIADINANIVAPKLHEWITDVIDNVRNKEIEVQDRSGHWYDLIMRPYITVENKIDGAVLTLIDIDTLKRDVTEFQKYQSYCEAIVDTMDSPVVLLDGQLKVKMVNRNFYDMFEVNKSETLNRDFYSLGSGQWNSKDLRELLHQVLPKSTVIEKYPIEHNFPNIGYRRLLLNARRIDLPEISERLILIKITNGAFTPKSSTKKRN